MNSILGVLPSLIMYHVSVICHNPRSSYHHDFQSEVHPQSLRSYSSSSGSYTAFSLFKLQILHMSVLRGNVRGHRDSPHYPFHGPAPASSVHFLIEALRDSIQRQTRSNWASASTRMSRSQWTTCDRTASRARNPLLPRARRKVRMTARFRVE